MNRTNRTCKPELNPTKLKPIRFFSDAKRIAGSLSEPSKMPCYGYSISAQRCITGSKLDNVEGSMCNHNICYAKNGFYSNTNRVPKAQEKRYQSLFDPRWCDAIVTMIEHHSCAFFRWHDSGDLQGIWHLIKIIEVVMRTPTTKHWLPTREYIMIEQFWEMMGKRPLNKIFPNLEIRLSATMVNGKAPYELAKKLGVGVSEVADNGTHTCPASEKEIFIRYGIKGRWQKGFCGSCLTPENLIITENGLKPISDIKMGEKVLTHLGRFRKTTKIFTREFKGNILEIKAYGSSFKTKITPEHPVLVSEQKHNRVGKRFLDTTNLQWIEASKLKALDRHALQYYLTFPRIRDITNTQSYPMIINFYGKNIIKLFPITNQLMTIIGYYLAEGYSTDRLRSNKKDREQAINFTFGKGIKEYNYAKELTDALVTLGYRPHLFITTKNLWKVKVNNVLLTQFFKKQFGYSSHNKKIPSWVLELPESKLDFLLNSYINGDGHKINEHQTTTSSVSIQLSNAIRLVAIKIGYSAYLNYYEPPKKTMIEGRLVNQSPIFIVILNNQHKSNIRSDSHFLYPKIRNIIKKPYSGKVYNLHVEEDESYCTSSFIVHNCRNCWNNTIPLIIYKKHRGQRWKK